MKTPFEIGTTYWLPVLTPQSRTISCPVCNGNLVVRVTLGNGDQVAVACDGCNVGCEGPRGVVTDYAYEHGAKPFTVKSVASMHGDSWYLDSAEGDHAAWADLCEDEATARATSWERMQQIISQNVVGVSARTAQALKRATWSVRYHEKCIADLEQRLAWHRAKISARTRHP